MKFVKVLQGRGGQMYQLMCDVIYGQSIICNAYRTGQQTPSSKTGVQPSTLRLHSWTTQTV